MKLFTKEIDKKLFAQYPKGGNLEQQVVVAKIFNPYGKGRWYLLNSDPQDPDYLWAIVQMGQEVEIGSVSRKELEGIRVSPFRFPLERDLGFSPKNAYEVYKGLKEGKFYNEGGVTEQSENKEMVLSQAEELEHHIDEFEAAAKKSTHVPAWIVAKTERAATDMSDSAHYLDSQNELKREKVEGEEIDISEEIDDFDLGGEVKVGDKVKSKSGVEGEVYESTGMFFKLKDKYGNKSNKFHSVRDFKPSEIKSMAGGGQISVKKYDNGKIATIPYGREIFLAEWDTERPTQASTIIYDNEYKILDVNSSLYQNVLVTLLKAMHENKITYTEVQKLENEKGGYMADGGTTSSPNSEFMKWFVDWSKSVNKYVYVSITKPNEFSSPIKDGNDKIVILDVIEKKGDTDAKKYINEMLKKADEFGVSIYLQPIPRTHNLKSEEHKKKITKDYLIKYYQKFGFENTVGGFMVRAPKMAGGGEVKFKDKVASIKASLLKRKNVPKAVQKDYGKTFTPAEAEDSAKRIVGAQTAKERLMMRIKSKKKK